MEKLEINILPKFIDEAATPIAQTVGNSISNIWNIIFGNQIELWNKKQLHKNQLNFEKYVCSTNSKIEEIPQEFLKEPELHILGPALEASKYYIDNEVLREMFANLISASVDLRQENIVHPSFVEIIKQLGPRDASVLNNFNEVHQFPIVQLKLVKDIKNVYQITHKHIMDFEDSSSDTDMSAILTNIVRLGLLEIDYTKHLSLDHVYNFIYNHPAYIEANELLTSHEYQEKDYREVKINKGIIYLTPLGKNFISTVCKNIK